MDEIGKMFCLLLFIIVAFCFRHYNALKDNNFSLNSLEYHLTLLKNLQIFVKLFLSLDGGLEKGPF